MLKYGRGFDKPAASAIAIKDSLILYVGNDYQEYAGSQTTLLIFTAKCWYRDL
jgi:predicted amidohydrolase YtcJ